MKLFAIITAGLMAAAGGVYYFTTASTCSKGTCTYPVAKTGGCCLGTEPAATTSCPSPCDECVAKDCTGCELCATNCAACCDVTSTVGVAARSVSAGAKGACCAANEECCLVGAACCTTQAVAAAAKPIEIVGCCEASCVSPARTISAAATSIASVK